MLVHLIRDRLVERLVVSAVLLVLGARAPALSAQAQEPDLAEALVDRDMTVAAGTTDVLAIHRMLARLEDAWVPTHWSEATAGSRALGIGYRVGKWIALDLPVDGFLMVVAHEVFGHGARLREVGASDIHYSFSAPVPYGDGSAVTTFDVPPEVAFTRADVLGIDTAGIEAQNVLADHIDRDALTSGSVSYHDAWLSIQSRVAGWLYIENVRADSGPGNDVADFLRNNADGCSAPLCTPIDRQTLRRRAWLMLANPMLASSIYAFAVQYLALGHTVTAVPTIPLPNGWHYLPTASFAMTPFGTEWRTDHYLRAGDRLTSIGVRIGQTGAQSIWDVELRTSDIVRHGRIGADAALDVWRQPDLDAAPGTEPLRAGTLLATTIRARLGTPDSRWRAIVQGGYKSAGFVPGERLRAGPIIRVGIAR